MTYESDRAKRSDGQCVYEAFLRASSVPFHDMWARIGAREQDQWEAFALTLPAEKIAADRAYPDPPPAAPSLVSGEGDERAWFFRSPGAPWQETDRPEMYRGDDYELAEFVRRPVSVSTGGDDVRLRGVFCPGCGGETLTAYEGGALTCSLLTCSSPLSARDVLAPVPSTGGDDDCGHDITLTTVVCAECGKDLRPAPSTGGEGQAHDFAQALGVIRIQREREAMLREALEWYANPESYVDEFGEVPGVLGAASLNTDDPDDGLPSIVPDKGYRARSALDELTPASAAEDAAAPSVSTSECERSVYWVGRRVRVLPEHGERHGNCVGVVQAIRGLDADVNLPGVGTVTFDVLALELQPATSEGERDGLYGEPIDDALAKLGPEFDGAGRRSRPSDEQFAMALSRDAFAVPPVPGVGDQGERAAEELRAALLRLHPEYGPDKRRDPEGNVWFCKIGWAGDMPSGADMPMRQAVEKAFVELAGADPKFVFSGWGQALDETQRAVVEDREPSDEHWQAWSTVTEFIAGHPAPSASPETEAEPEDACMECGHSADEHDWGEDARELDGECQHQSCGCEAFIEPAPDASQKEQS